MEHTADNGITSQCRSRLQQIGNNGACAHSECPAAEQIGSRPREDGTAVPGIVVGKGQRRSSFSDELAAATAASVYIDYAACHIHEAGVVEGHIDRRGVGARGLAERTRVVEILAAITGAIDRLIVLCIEHPARQVVDAPNVIARTVVKLQISRARPVHRPFIGQRPIQIERATPPNVHYRVAPDCHGTPAGDASTVGPIERATDIQRASQRRSDHAQNALGADAAAIRQ